MIETILSLAEIAAMCRVSEDTVRWWYSSKKLKGRRRPGNGEHLIPQASLDDFRREHQLPVIWDDEHLHAIAIVISRDKTVADTLQSKLAANPIRVLVARNDFAATLLAESARPDIVIVDWESFHWDPGERLLQAIASYTNNACPILVLVSAGNRPINRRIGTRIIEFLEDRWDLNSTLAKRVMAAAKGRKPSLNPE